MIPHDPALDAAYGRVLWQPTCRVVPIRNGVEGGPLVPIDGMFRSDATQWPRTEVTMSLPTDVTPSTTTTPLSPYGDRVRVEVGIVAGGFSYGFTVGTFDVHTADINRPDGTIEVSAVSSEARVNEDRYTDKDATPAGTSSSVVAGIVSRTLGAGYPVTVAVTNDPVLAAGAFPLDGDVWPTVEAIADAAGWDVSFTSSGGLLLRDTPRKGTPSTTLTTGDSGTLTGYRSRRSWAYNRVAVVYEENAGATPARRVGLWEDTDPNSATRVTGPYGRHTRRDVVDVDPGKLPTAAAANAAALDVARRSAAPFRSLELRAIPCPWVEPGDTVRVAMLGGLVEDHVVAAIEWPLSLLDVATITTQDATYTGASI